MFTCIIRYEINPERIEEFREYAATWKSLVEKYGGKHHGYFRPPSEEEKTTLPNAAFSFQSLGKPFPPNSGFAFFSFDNKENYEIYKQKAANDPECKRATVKFNAKPCFTRYERCFAFPA